MAAHAEEHDRPVAGLYLLDPPPPGAGAAAAAYDDQQMDAVFARDDLKPGLVHAARVARGVFR